MSGMQSPGRLGIVELALTAGLRVAGGPRPGVVAAVLIYRVLTLFVQVPIGAACYLYWRSTAQRRAAKLESAGSGGTA
jgi:putative heme transporter